MASFPEFLSHHGIRFVHAGEHHHAHNGWINFDCPFCSPGSGKYRMGYNLTGKYVSCWSCGSHGTIETVCRLSGLTYSDGAIAVKGFGSTLAIAPRPRGILRLPRGIGPVLPQHRKYLAGRGFDVDQLIRLWGIGAIAHGGKLSWRVFIPAYNKEQLIVSWTTRSISDNVNSRYISASVADETEPLKHLLYGEQYCRHSIIVTEGPLDAWAIGPGAVSVCGMSYTRQQLLRMTKYVHRVILFDNEPEAQRRAQKLSDDLSVFDGETFTVKLDGKDAASSSPRELELLRKKFLR